MNTLWIYSSVISSACKDHIHTKRLENITEKNYDHWSAYARQYFIEKRKGKALVSLVNLASIGKVASTMTILHVYVHKGNMLLLSSLSFIKSLNIQQKQHFLKTTRNLCISRTAIYRNMSSLYSFIHYLREIQKIWDHFWQHPISKRQDH